MWGCRLQCVSSCAASVAQLGLWLVLWSGARLSCRHRGQMPLIRLASNLQAAQIQRKSTARGEQKGTKRETEIIRREVFVCVCFSMHFQSHPYYDHTVCDVYMFFLASQSERWCMKSGLSFSGSCFHRVSSFCHHLSLPWNLRRSITLPVSDLAIAHFTPAVPSVSLLLLVLVTRSVFLAVGPLLLLSLLLLFSSEQGFCVIKFIVVPLVDQLCHPDGQIKNWSIWLIPSNGWMLLPSSWFYFFSSILTYRCTFLLWGASYYSHFCSSIKSTVAFHQ